MPIDSSLPIGLKRSMPGKVERASFDIGPVGSIEQALVTLKLSAKDPEQSRKLDHVLYVLRDVVSGPNIMVCCEDQEALWWEVFAEVYATEVSCVGVPAEMLGTPCVLIHMVLEADSPPTSCKHAASLGPIEQVAVMTNASGGKEPSSSCKRQILADILVWAEVTQDHYDSGTQR